MFVLSVDVNFDGCLFQLCISHLRCNGTLPYQFVQSSSGGIGTDLGGSDVGGTYGFVCFLRTL